MTSNEDLLLSHIDSLELKIQLLQATLVQLRDILATIEKSPELEKELDKIIPLDVIRQL